MPAGAAGWRGRAPDQAPDTAPGPASIAGVVWLRSVAAAMGGGAVIGALVGLYVLGLYAFEPAQGGFSLDRALSVAVVGTVLGGAVGGAVGLPLGIVAGVWLAMFTASPARRSPGLLRVAACAAVAVYVGAWAVVVPSVLMAGPPALLGAVVLGPRVVPPWARPRGRAANGRA